MLFFFPQFPCIENQRIHICRAACNLAMGMYGLKKILQGRRKNGKNGLGK